MTIQELIKSANDRATDTAVKEFEKRVVEREKKFNEESRSQAADDEFMARSYNL